MRRLKVATTIRKNSKIMCEINTKHKTAHSIKPDAYRAFLPNHDFSHALQHTFYTAILKLCKLIKISKLSLQKHPNA